MPYETSASRTSPNKVVHIATLVTPDGAFGGPTRIAANLVKELNSQGRTAELWSGSSGYSREMRFFEGAPIRPFWARVLSPKIGFTTTTSPTLWIEVLKGRSTVDMLHIHMARDLVTLPAALLARMLRIPYVLQMHGMVMPKTGLMAQLFDVVLTRFALRGARTIICSTEFEEDKLHEFDRHLRHLEVLPNGIDVGVWDVIASDTNTQGTASCQVLYLARMHQRKRPVFFVRSALEVLGKERFAEFRMVGPDEGELTTVIDEIKSSKFSSVVHYEGSLPPELTKDRMAKCDIYVLPSVDEPFPMSVIEAMALGKPVVITDTCGLAPFVERAGAGLVVNSSQESLTAAIDELVQDHVRRKLMGGRARELVRKELHISSVTQRLCTIYDRATQVAADTR